MTPRRDLIPLALSGLALVIAVVAVIVVAVSWPSGNDSSAPTAEDWAKLVAVAATPPTANLSVAAPAAQLPPCPTNPQKGDPLPVLPCRFVKTTAKK